MKAVDKLFKYGGGAAYTETELDDMCGEIESLRAQLEAQSGEAEEAAYLCSNCGPIAHTEVDALDQTLGCTRCNGVMWGDDGITIEPLYTSPPAAKVPDKITPEEAVRCNGYNGEDLTEEEANGFADGWNTCRKAMLSAQEGEK
jgi:hypothetical protein